MSFKYSQFKPVVMLILISISLPLQSINVYADEVVISTPSASVDVEEQVSDQEIVETGDASTTIEAENVINTTVVDTSASEPATQSSQPDLNADNFNLEATCSDLNQLISDLNIEINNQTTIEQVFNLIANSGSNQVENGQIITGDADGEVQLVQQINTTLIGSCWSYLDKTIFEETKDDIYLPYEGEILNNAKSEATTSAQSNNPNKSSTNISIDNDANNNQDVSQNTNTGENSTEGGSIATGNSSSNTQVIDTINKNIVGNNWFYIEIINPYYWSGEVVGQNLEFTKNENIWYYWQWFGNEPAPATSENQPIEKKISVNNTADIDTKINTDVNTGNNQILENGDITTGDARSSVKIRNNINTTIIGDNWYYVSINLFAPFTGNLIFERVDLIASIPTASLSLRPGDILDLPIIYENKGQISAKNSRINVEIPEELELISQNYIEKIGNIVSFDIGALSSGETGVFNVKFRAKNFHSRFDSRLKIWLSSATLDANLANNRTGIKIKFRPYSEIGGIRVEEAETNSEEQVEELDVLANILPVVNLMPNLINPVFAQNDILGDVDEVSMGGLAHEQDDVLVDTANFATTAQNSIFLDFQLWLVAIFEWFKKSFNLLRQDLIN